MADERLTDVQAAARADGIKRNTFRSYVARGRAPEADGVDEFSGRQFWYASTIDAWMASRSGQGVGGGAPSHRR